MFQPALAVLAAALLALSPAAVADEFAPRDFARLPNVSFIEISDGGTYLSSVMSTEEGDRALMIQDLTGATKPYMIKAGSWRYNWTSWISDEQLAMGVALPMSLDGTPVSVRRLVVADPKARSTHLLFRREKERGFIQVQDELIGTRDGKLLVEGNPQRADLPRVYAVKPSASRLPNTTYQRASAGILGWQADADGEVRVGWGIERDQSASLLRIRDGAGKWHDYSELSERDCQVMALPTNTPDEVFLQCPGPSGFGAVRRFTVSTGEMGAVVAERSHTDVSSIVLNADGTDIDVVVYTSELEPTEYRQETLSQLVGLLDKHSPETHNYVVDWSDDYRRVVLGAVSDTLPRHYFLYDADTKRIDYYTSAYPDLLDNAPGEMFSVSYRARDGLEIPAYVTLPRGLDLESAKTLPFIVFPHGGPHARDFLSFDWMTQMFAAAGYGTLQMNFRGSTGYGLEFQRAGEKQWGQAMQDDITDGTHWLIEQGIADADKICIFGGSYGGYAALMGVVKEPELYRCAASLNGVTDLVDTVRNASQYIGGKYGTRHIGKLWSDRKMLRENSPRRRADEIKVPVFLAHGEKDRVVEVSQSRRMSRALSDEVLWKYLEMPDGDHYLSIQSNRVQFAEALMDFFAGAFES